MFEPEGHAVEIDEALARLQVALSKAGINEIDAIRFKTKRDVGKVCGLFVSTCSKHFQTLMLAPKLRGVRLLYGE